MESFTNEDRMNFKELGYTDKEIDEIKIMLGGKVIEVISNAIPRAYHKGEWCDKINRTCTEGYCDQCEPVANKENYKKEE